MEPDSLFLSLEQAREAVCGDFRQYGPQLMLFCEVHRILPTGGRLMVHGAPENGVWVSVPRRDEMRWLAGRELVEYMCRCLENPGISVDQWVSVCSRVFRTRASREKDPDTAQTGIRVQTGMEGFACLQCGLCCRSLDYSDELTEADVACWQKLDRTDILKWVGISRSRDGRVAYQMWLVPGTRKFAEVCPFLKHLPSENRWICQIHDVKPEICRNYPVSRKHAAMTGCPGFDKLPAGPAVERKSKNNL